MTLIIFFKEFFNTILSSVSYGNWESSQLCRGTVVEYAAVVEQAIGVGYEIVPLWNSPTEIQLISYFWDDLEKEKLSDENFKKALNLFKKLFKNDVKDWYPHEFFWVVKNNFNFLS